jgi:5-methyltetrahydrofolate--homocysteine methyltransferase
MSIEFSPARWQAIQQAYSDWWTGRLSRPLLGVTLSGAPAGRPEPDLPSMAFTAGFGLDTPAEDIIDRVDYDLSCQRWHGDAFPTWWPNFGPGILAGFLGARVEAAADTVWFHPPDHRELADLELSIDADNPWLGRVEQLCRLGSEQWNGKVQIGMTDLGGNLDVLATFRPGEQLLLDLYDDPQTVEQLTWRVHQLWREAFERLNASLQPTNPGYTAWTPIFSETPYYMLQCDLAYMISPEMFDRFVKPELTACCRLLDRPFYHLDGPGQLPHLDRLLEIPDLAGVQWVPGDGQPPPREWVEVYRKIHAAGKRIHLLGELDDLEAVADALGTAAGIYMHLTGELSQADVLRRRLEAFDVPWGGE